jgi:hypothetical protein
MPRGQQRSRLSRIKEALDRLPTTASDQGEADARQALYPTRPVRQADPRRDHFAAGLELAEVEAAINSSPELTADRRAQLLSYVRELADFYERRGSAEES